MPVERLRRHVSAKSAFGAIGLSGASSRSDEAPVERGFLRERATGIEPATSSLESGDRIPTVERPLPHVGRDGCGFHGV